MFESPRSTTELDNEPAPEAESSSRALGNAAAKETTPASSSGGRKEDDENDEDAGGGDDLFGGEDEEEDEDEEEEKVVVKSSRSRRQISSASPSPSAPHEAKGRASTSVSPSPTPRASPSRSPSIDSYTALEHRETSAEPPMGVREGDGAQTEIQEASFTLPSLPFRRGLPHFFARLPNLLQYRSEAFDEDDFDEKKEDEMLQSKDGIRIDDEGLRSLLTTSNTIRWRWTGDVDKEGYRIPESNARIVKWSDGSSSLQLGSEFYDISTASERVQSDSQKTLTTSSSQSTSRVPPQPDQHLTHLFVKHDGQEQVNMYQAETPIVASFTFRPTSTASESHQRLAKAVRKQKGTLVKATVVTQDPELEKERKEKEEKKRSQKRVREMRKRQKGKDEEDDDAFWDSAARSARKTGARSLAVDGTDEGLNGMEEEDDVVDDDGFVVDDENDEDGEGEQEEDMDVDSEPDEMELMEAQMEKQEALRKAGKAGKTEPELDSAKAGGTAGDDDAATTTRKRRVIDSDDEDA